MIAVVTGESPVRFKCLRYTRSELLARTIIQVLASPFRTDVREKQSTPPSLSLFSKMKSPSIPNIDSFSELLGIPKYVLTKYVFERDYYYKTFRIAKRNRRGYRLISAPCRELKGIQRWIKAFILEKVPLPDSCTGFRRGISIVDNADPHVDKDFVLNLDLEEFFPSITIARIVGLFKSFGYPAESAFALARLTTHRDRLPQGAPSSPLIANILCRRLDARLSALAKRRDWSYTRYCDDLTISGNGNVRIDERAGIIQIIRDEGFSINRRKTRVSRRNSSQTVTGLVVNSGVRVPRHRRRAWRAMFHQAGVNPARFRLRLGEMAGYLAYLQMVSPNSPEIGRYRSTMEKLER